MSYCKKGCKDNHMKHLYEKWKSVIERKDVNPKDAVILESPEWTPVSDIELELQSGKRCKNCTIYFTSP